MGTEFAHDIQCCIQFLLIRQTMKTDVHTFEHNFIALFFQPGFQHRIQRIAVRAEVTEKLDDFDFFTGFGWLWFAQHFVFDAGFRCVRCSDCTGGQ